MSAPASEIYIVSGLPRSGTSMMMQMLTAGGIPALTDHVRTADEDNRRGYFEFEPVKQIKSDVSWLAEARGHVVKLIYMLLYHLPQDYTYRVVFLRRNLDEVLASQTEMLKRRGEQGATVSDDQLKTIFTDQLAKVDDWIEKQPNLQVLYVEHRDVLKEPQQQADRINAFLGGGLDTDAMVAVVSPELYRQRSAS